MEGRRGLSQSVARDGGSTGIPSSGATDDLLCLMQSSRGKQSRGRTRASTGGHHANTGRIMSIGRHVKWIVRREEDIRGSGDTRLPNARPPSAPTPGEDPGTRARDDEAIQGLDSGVGGQEGRTTESGVESVIEFPGRSCVRGLDKKSRGSRFEGLVHPPPRKGTARDDGRKNDLSKSILT